MNTVDIWHSLKVSEPYNQLLIIAVDHLLPNQINARVIHMLGHKNVVADAVSRFNNAEALRLVPGLQIVTFHPPRGMMGAAQR
jgi:hypothetical protein